MTAKKIKRELLIDVTPKECGEVFASMNSDDQAEFFNSDGEEEWRH